MYKSILVPIDTANISDSKKTIETAKSIGGDAAEVILLTVVEEIPTWAAVEMPKGVVEKSIENTRQSLKDFAADTDTEMLVEVRSGHPYKTILDVAAEKSTDLIIVNSHQPELQDYFLGSTAAKVVRHAKCSVLVIR